MRIISVAYDIIIAVLITSIMAAMTAVPVAVFLTYLQTGGQ